MRYPNDRLPYEIARNCFDQGLACDRMSGLIARELPAFLNRIADRVKAEMTPPFYQGKEAGWLKHYGHGGQTNGAPNDPDCACRGTTAEWECAYYGGCGFCRAAQTARDLECGGA